MRSRLTALITCALVWIATPLADAQKKVWTPLRAGDPAAPFTVQTLEGSSVTSADLRGKVVLLNFWGTY